MVKKRDGRECVGGNLQVACTFIYMCIHTFSHNYIHTCIHTCMHTYKEIDRLQGKVGPSGAFAKSRKRVAGFYQGVEKGCVGGSKGE